MATEGGTASRGGDGVYLFGQVGDKAVVGDWNGDGISKLGVFRKGQWILDTNGNKVFRSVRRGFQLWDAYRFAGGRKLESQGTSGPDWRVPRWNVWFVDSNGDRIYESTDLQFSFRSGWGHSGGFA